MEHPQGVSNEQHSLLRNSKVHFIYLPSRLHAELQLPDSQEAHPLKH